MVAELLEDVDRLERLRVLPAEQRLDLGGGNEEPVEGELQFRRPAEHNLLVLDGHCTVTNINPCTMPYPNSKGYIRYLERR